MAEKSKAELELDRVNVVMKKRLQELKVENEKLDNSPKDARR